MRLDLLWREGQSVDKLGTAVRDVLAQAERRIIKDVSIGTTETMIVHGASAIPAVVFVAPHSNVTWWRTRVADARFVYLAASVACVADIEVVL